VRHAALAEELTEAAHGRGLVNRPAWPYDIVFIEVDGESLEAGEDGSDGP
jgi:hypothetical protein